MANLLYSDIVCVEHFVCGRDFCGSWYLLCTLHNFYNK